MNNKMDWKKIDGNDNYLISSDGKVKSMPRLIDTKICKHVSKERLMNFSLSTKGYYRCKLKLNNKNVGAYVHTLVAKAYISNPKNLPQVNHIDGDKLNNKVENLEWIDNRGNVSHHRISKFKTSKYVGVSKHNSGHNKWISKITVQYKQIYLGLFDDEFDAYMAYQGALKERDLINNYSKIKDI